MTVIERLTAIAARLKMAEAATREHQARREFSASRDEVLRAIAQLKPPAATPSPAGQVAR